MEEGDEVWDGVKGWVNVDGWCNVVGGGRVETWETAREGVDGWAVGGARWKCSGGWEASCHNINDMMVIITVPNLHNNFSFKL